MDFILFRKGEHCIIYRNAKKRTDKVAKAILARLAEIVGRPDIVNDRRWLINCKHASEHGHTLEVGPERFSMAGKGWSSSNYPRAKLHYADK